MAKKNSEKKSNLKDIAEPLPGGVKGGSVIFDASAFDEMDGELFAGLNILKLKPGQAAGPIVIKDILLNQKLGKDSAAKKRKPVDVYVGSAGGAQVRLPVAASFIQKMKDAKVAIGDTIAIKRGEDYKSQFNTSGASYELKVLARAE